MSAAKQMKNATQTNNIKLTRRGFLAAVGTSAAGLAFQRISVTAENQSVGKEIAEQNLRKLIDRHRRFDET